MCVYGMEGPGGYQFVGRTLQMWNRWRTTSTFEKPWLLRFFDRIRFFPVSAEELLDIREAFPRGGYNIRIDEGTFNLRDYNHFLKENSSSINAFKQTQQTAFEEERERWQQSGHGDLSLPMEAELGDDREIVLRDGEVLVSSHVPGSVWMVAVQEGDTIEPDTPLVIVESMKMEMAVASPKKLLLRKLFATAGMQVQPGTVLAIAEIVA
ncbi:MAG: carboxyltransferase domain-containing protein, partial [Pseudomonadales bacterium]|nr:carboxyltransferase domain-containing protein [Pseudomonadales bacterium]